LEYNNAPLSFEWPLLAESGHWFCFYLPGLNVRYYPKAVIQNRAVEKPHQMTGLRPKAAIELLLRLMTANDPLLPFAQAPNIG